MHHGFYFLAHVVVLVAELNLYGSFAILLVDLACQVLNLAFAALEASAVNDFCGVISFCPSGSSGFLGSSVIFGFYKFKKFNQVGTTFWVQPRYFRR